MKRFIGLTMIAWMFLTVSMVKAQDKTGSPAGEEVKLKPQTTCPVLDGAISRDKEFMSAVQDVWMPLRRIRKNI